MFTWSGIARSIDNRDYTTEQVNYIHLPRDGGRSEETARSIIEEIALCCPGTIERHESEPGIGWFSLEHHDKPCLRRLRFVCFFGEEAVWDAYFARKRGERNETAAVAGDCA